MQNAGPSDATTLDTSLRKDHWVHLVAGGTGAALSTTVTFPLDVIKTRLQSDLYHDNRQLIAAEWPKSIQHSSIGQLARTIYSREGWRALFRGLAPNLWSFVPESAIGFYAYGNTKRLLAEILYDGRETSAVHLLAAIISGLATETLTNPLWVIKTRLQLDSELASGRGRKFKNSWDCFNQIVRLEGITALYRGLSMSYLGVSEFALQWVLYERMKVALEIRAKGTSGKLSEGLKSTLEWIGAFGAASAFKFIAATAAYPHEVIRTRLRQQPRNSGKRRYVGALQTFETIRRQEGIAGFYGGLHAHLWRVVPGAAILFGTYEAVLVLLGEANSAS